MYVGMRTPLCIIAICHSPGCHPGNGMGKQSVLNNDVTSTNVVPETIIWLNDCVRRNGELISDHRFALIRLH